MVTERTLRVGDQVEVILPLPHHRAPAVGTRGQVVCVGLAFGAVTVNFDKYGVRAFQIRPVHLRRVDGPA